MRINYRYKKRITLLLFFTLILFGVQSIIPSPSNAAVKGACYVCHTMHNSADGLASVRLGASSGWTASGELGTGIGGAQEDLLKTDCVGCHSTSTNANIVTVGGTQIPIVWNTAGASIGDLAGGNFSHVVTDQGNGHNVLGITAADGNLLGGAPGMGNAGCALSCHISLVTAVDLADGVPGIGNATNNSRNGCEGCHLKVGHHQPYEGNSGASEGLGVLGAGDSYRFLGGHLGGLPMIPNNNSIIAFEDPDWGATSADFNLYRAQAPGNNNDDAVLGRFCAGCHSDFHAFGNGVDPVSGLDNGGDPTNVGGSNPWLRHPTNISINQSIETAGTLQGEAYNDAMPLARTGLDRGVINAGDQVMCLTCHKAHGSENADALRFVYNTGASSAHVNAGSTTGCFYCHRAKANP